MYKCFDYNGRKDKLSTCRYVVLESEKDLSDLVNDLNDRHYAFNGLNTFEVDTSIFPTAVEWNALEWCWNFVSPNDYPAWLIKEIEKTKTNLHEKEEVKFMYYKCFDDKGNADIIDTCTYVLVNNYGELYSDFVKEDIIIDGLENAYEEAKQKYPFVVKMNKDSEEWEYLSPDNYPTWLNKEITKFKSESITYESTDTNAKLYNLYVIFKSGITLQTNTEPITFEDIAEAIEVLQKPSIFGKQIAEFKIEVL